jgi:hypothetical protein
MAYKDNLVAWWTFDETSGNRADSHGSNTAVPTGTPGYGTGKKGNALDLEITSVNEYLTVTDNDSISLNATDFTICGWVYFESLSGTTLAFLLSKYAAAYEYSLYYTPGATNRFNLTVFHNGVNDPITASVAGATTGVWYFIAATFNNTSKALTISVDNGTPGTATATGKTIANTATNLFIGTLSAAPGNDAYTLDGMMDEWAIWKRVLTAEEITWLYNAGAGRTYSELDAGAALTALDMTLNPVTFNAPTLVNVPAVGALVGKDLTLSAVTFDSPILEFTWNTPSCRTLVIGALSREYKIPYENRDYKIGAMLRGYKVTCKSGTLYTPTAIIYNGLTGLDLTLNRPTLETPALVGFGVPLPDPAFATLPFGIFDDGDGTFSITPGFDLETYANITVAKTYYVATTGSDSNDGSSGSPFLTINKALGMADVDKIVVAAGWYRPWGLSEPIRNIKIIGVGDVYVTQDYMGSLSWTLDSAHYESACVATISAVLDKTATDANGDWSLLTLKTSEAEVEANASSWWLDDPGNVLHVHTHDGRAPDANVVVLFSTSGIVAWTIDNLKVYIENIKFVGASGGVTIGSATSAGTTTKAYLKDCSFDGADVSGYGFYALGCSEFILQNCTSKRTDDDGIRSNPANTINSNVVEIDCTMRSCGKSGDSSINGSSSHSDGTMVRINGSYHHTYGRPVHDFNNGHSWCLGVHANNGLTAGLPNFEMTSGEMWCDQCVSADSTYDFAGNIHKHDCTGDASDGAGTDTYDY